MNIRMMASDKVYTVTEVGYFTPYPKQDKELTCGSVGYIAASIKTCMTVKWAIPSLPRKRRGRTASGIQKGASHGLLRPLSGGEQGL